jgi:uncharacterized membrane protein YhaH (DUF805 family)
MTPPLRAAPTTQPRTTPMDWLYLFNSFEGRIGRQTFWIAFGAAAVANVLACYVAGQLDGERLSAIVDLAFTYPQFAVAAKRAHDRNLPIWVLIIFFAINAVLDLFDVLGLSGTPEQPSTAVLVIGLPFTVFGLALLIELGFRKGAAGPNRYGPEPS